MITLALLLAALAQETYPPATVPPPAEAPPARPAAEEEEPPAAPAEAASGPGTGEIVVTGQRLRGEVVGNVQPELRLNEEQVRAYGASTISELVDALAPQTRSGRQDGPPIVLLNGRRISGFGEIRDLPVEAIERVDILPEEVALSYGYRPDRRVMNIVLKENFRSLVTGASVSVPTAGGQQSFDGNAGLVRIDPSARWNVEARYQRAGALLESERDLIQSSPAFPFDLAGNVGASPFVAGAEVDPALSAAAGTTVTVAAVPPSAATGAPSLADFVPGANRPNLTDLGQYRTLLPATEALTLGGAYNRSFGNVSATVNARFGTTSSESRFGLPSLSLILPETNPYSPFSRDVGLFRYADAAGPLRSETRGRTVHGGLTLDSMPGSWRWNFTANYDWTRTVTRTDTNADPAAIQARLTAGDPTLNPFAAIGPGLLVLSPADRAESVSQSADAQLVFNGPLVSLPAGQVTASLTLAGDTRSLDSETIRSGVTQVRELGRDRGAILGSFEIPVTSRRDGVLAAVGTISLNLNFELEHVSDFGTLRTLGYGVRWDPVSPLGISVNVNDEDNAPGMQQLGDPLLVTPNVRLFDYVGQETVDVSRITGGNPDLLKDNRRVVSVRVNLRLLGGAPGPVPSPTLSLIVNYTDSRTENPIFSFPAATAEIQAAFPDRYLRNAEGRLVQVDVRPVNFARATRRDVRWGLNFQMPFATPRPAGGPGAAPGPGPGGPGPLRGPGAGVPRGPRGPGGGAPRGPGGPGLFFGGGQSGGNLLGSLFHTWRLTDEVLIRPGLPTLDYLGGSAFGGGGGRPRHEFEAQIGLFRNGAGGFLRATWQSGTVVRGAAGTSGDLRFSDLATVNLVTFADLGQRPGLVRRFGFLRGAHVQFSVTNIFDSRLRVRDDNGLTPLGYQGDYLDPLGRTVRIGIRKLFF